MTIRSIGMILLFLLMTATEIVLSAIHWATDIHLDHLSDRQLDKFLANVKSLEGGVFVITGDISNSARLNYHLGAIMQASRVPVHFVLGNHDYYHGSVKWTRVIASGFSYRDDGTHLYLTDAGPLRLTDRTWIAGVDGWADARAGGDFLKSRVWIKDYSRIEDLSVFRERQRTYIEHLNDQGKEKNKKELEKVANFIKREIRTKLRKLADQQARRLGKQLRKVPDDVEHILVATHVPPWVEAAWHNGTTSDDDWAPHFVCVATGKVMKEFMEEHPGKSMTVLCGHTHGAGEAQILPNLKCITGSSCEDGSDDYQRPWINTVEVL